MYRAGRLGAMPVQGGRQGTGLPGVSEGCADYRASLPGVPVQPLIPFFEVPILQLGPLAIHGFGLLVALGFWQGGNVAIRRANESGLEGEHINRLLTWLILGTFIGGHVGFGLMYAREEYLADPVKFLYFWQGLSSFGGFVVCVPLSIWYFRKHKLRVWPFMDSLAVGLSLGWFFGRMGCTVAHDHPGTPSNFFLAKYCRPVEGHTLHLPSFLTGGSDHAAHDLRWGPCLEEGQPIYDAAAGMVDLATYPGQIVAAHDMGFYEALWSLAMFGIFLFLDKRFTLKPGVIVCLLGVTYGPVRFAMDYLRPVTTDNRWFADTMIAMTPGQFWSLVFFAVSAVFLVQRLRADDTPICPQQPLDADV